MKTLEQLPVIDEKAVVTKSGRKFRSYHQKLLDNMPSDLVKEMARRELEKIEKLEKGEGKI